IAFMMVILFSVSCGPSSVTVGARLDAPYYERPVRPYPNYVWVEGDWIYRNGRYEYQRGYWQQPRRSRHFVAGAWIQRSNGWYWRRGRWQH
ncbi:MAG TPA: hypothetical protein VLJ68_00390, partial [Chitinophagaceae bacterium]|nr:hypothetical protein [Chitinophagaceae bacterium]